MKKSIQVFIFLAIIVLTGLLGGIGNFFIIANDVRELDPQFNLGDFNLQKSLVLGIIAAGVIPLFLNIISSNLLEITEENRNYKNYFIFGGLCLVASLFSNRFLTGAYDNAFQQFNNKVVKVEKLANEAKKNADAALQTDIVNQQIEQSKPKNKAEKPQYEISSIANKYGLDSKEERILNKILENKIIYKTDAIKGIGDSVEGQEAIDKLINNGLIQELKVQDDLVLSIKEKVFKEDVIKVDK